MYSHNDVISINGKDYRLWLESGAVVDDDALSYLPKGEAVAYELARYPLEQSHNIDPSNMKTQVFEPGAILVEQRFGDMTPDRHFFDRRTAFYALATELSVHGDILFTPSARYRQETTDDPCADYLRSLFGEYELMLRYGSMAKAFSGFLDCVRAFFRPRHFDGIRRLMVKQWLRMVTAIPYNLSKRHRYKGARYTPSPRRGSDLMEPTVSQPLISVIVRTHNRPQTLLKTLRSLTYQTYKNFETIVVEDGKPTAKEVCDGFEVQYYPTHEPVGRGAAANIGLSLSKGEYCCFLDDDDFFYPDFLERSVNSIGDSMLTVSPFMTRFEDADGNVCGYEYNRFDRINIMDMCIKSRFALHSVLFRRELYEKCGGMREDIDAHEDWTMWLKFLSYAGINNIQYGTDRATCVYTNPIDVKTHSEKQRYYSTFDRYIQENDDIKFSLSVKELNEIYREILKDVAHLKKEKKLEPMLDEFFGKNDNIG